MKRFFRLVVVAFIGLGLAAAQQATVNHGVIFAVRTRS